MNNTLDIFHDGDECNIDGISSDTADLSVIGEVTEKLMLDTRILHEELISI